ncbi:carboxypeptidase-like regulatory domain-containing protein [Paludibaculum fermentans]|uniref:Carboxypeptidase regulatory-like domain-containing protein n=1 Tax=Paludibaculum fermentans TaxID=1473598 RepID=A0A7S7NN65_PALFE|nr:carboxypeptidase-like regulatory domain-containing protein [Paludibaculum fermentans]QOY86701.1 carboxypeptidase regulatory-like domain-containing protein [Paludibaculum fermentans]
MFQATLALFISLSAFAQAGGSIRARFTDSAGGAVVAEVRVLELKDGAEVFHGHAEPSGTVLTSALKPGNYRLIASAPGFRRVDLRGVRVKAGKMVDLGPREMGFSGCDTPGMSCSYYGSSTEQIDWRAEIGDHRGSVRVHRQCGLDIDNEVKTVCPEPNEGPNWLIRSGFELRVVEAKGHFYLEAVNGAAISRPNSSDASCGDARFTKSRIPVDGLGTGVDFCTRSTQGSVAHVFFTEDVERGSESIALWVVTRKR